MDNERIVAAILSIPIVSQLGNEGGDIPPEVAVSIYEEVLKKVKHSHQKDSNK